MKQLIERQDRVFWLCLAALVFWLAVVVSVEPPTWLNFTVSATVGSLAALVFRWH